MVMIMVVGSCANIIVGNFIKNLFGLPRPYGEGISSLAVEKDFGFPSTHTINAIVNTGFVVFVCTESIAFRIFYLFYIICVSFSRMYMGVHSPADVCCGVLIGFLHLFIMVNFYKYIIAFLSNPISLPILIIFFMILLTMMPRCKDYNSTPKRTGMICGCITAIAIVMSFKLNVTTDVMPQPIDYIKYQFGRIGWFALEYVTAGVICLPLFVISGFVLPELLMKFAEKNVKVNAILRKIEMICSKYRFHCLRDDINAYECDKVMLKYTLETPLAFFTGMIGALEVLYFGPKIVLYMNPEMIQQL